VVSWEAERTLAAPPFSERVGAAFQLLMQIRMLIAALNLALLIPGQRQAAPFVLLLFVATISWLSARYWREIAPRMAAHPLLLVLDICLSFVVLGFGGTSGPFLLATVVTAALAGLLYWWPGMLAVAGLQISCYYISMAVSGPIVPDFQTLLGQPIYYPLAGFAGVALRRLLDDFAAHEAALRNAEVAAAAAQERSRLAREMHDSLAKTLRGLAFAAAALPEWLTRDPTRAKAESERIVAAAEIASREARSLLTELRDETLISPLPEAVCGVVERWSETVDIAVTCDIDARVDLPLRVRHELVAILGEVLTNVERHAAATSVDVKLTRENGHVVLGVRDDGKGFAQREITELVRDGHYGLVGMRERAERIGGTVAVLSETGAGTTVTVRVSADQPAESELAEVS
jgi:signal transduction histidine kinase